VNLYDFLQEVGWGYYLPYKLSYLEGEVNKNEPIRLL